MFIYLPEYKGLFIIIGLIQIYTYLQIVSLKPTLSDSSWWVFTPIVAVVVDISPADLSLDGQRNTSSSQDSCLGNNFFSWSISRILFLLCRTYLASFPYQLYFFSHLFLKLLYWWNCRENDGQTEKKRLTAHCWFLQAQDYLLSAQRRVKEKVRKSYSHSSIALHLRKFFEIRPNGSKYLQYILRLKVRQEKSPPVSSAEIVKRQKNTMKFPVLQQSGGKSPLVQQRPWRLCSPALKAHGPLALQCILLLPKLFHLFRDQLENIAVAVGVICNTWFWQRLTSPYVVIWGRISWNA